eukprot:973073-Rhodomonas_salina.1
MFSVESMPSFNDAADKDGGADPNISAAASRGSETWALAVRVKQRERREKILLALVRNKLEVHAPFIHIRDWVLPFTYAIKTEDLALFHALLAAGTNWNNPRASNVSTQSPLLTCAALLPGADPNACLVRIPACFASLRIQRHCVEAPQAKSPSLGGGRFKAESSLPVPAPQSF